MFLQVRLIWFYKLGEVRLGCPGMLGKFRLVPIS